ncbi:hypothetical protein B0J17DRAFT_719388 [Rhizoctonia solani]|nr:hypothetical protein B0J17DRAFT_719388 [Rhizoctonia solani]
MYGVLEYANLIDIIGHITLNNASHSDTLMAELECAFIEKGHPLDCKLNWICEYICFPHVINLAVKAFLDVLPQVAQQTCEEAKAQGIQFNNKLNKELLEYLHAMESDPVGLCWDSMNALQSSNAQCEGLQATIVDGNCQQLFKTLYGKILFVSKLELLCNTKNQWSSTYLMILCYLILYPVCAV